MENMAASSFKRSLFVLRSSSIGSRRAGSRKVHFCKKGIFFLGRKHFVGENILGSFGSKFAESGSCYGALKPSPVVVATSST